MILQLGVKPSWFNSYSTSIDAGDLRSYMIESTLPAVGDPVVPELLLKILEPYRIEGMSSVLRIGWCFLITFSA